MGNYIGYNNVNLSLALKRYLSGAGESDDPDRVVIERAIVRAEGEADAYLGVKYSMPLEETSESAALKGAVEKIARYLLYYDHESAEIPVKVDEGYERAIAYLKELAKKLATLGLATDDEKEAKKTSITKTVRG